MWHRQGKVSLTKGSDVVTGVGTNWVENIRVGDAFQGPDGKLYQVINVASNEALAISPAYEGNTATNLNYWIVPIPGYSKTQADRLSLIISKLDEDIVTATEAADRAQAAAQQAQQWRNEAAVSAAAALQSEQSAALSADSAEQARDDAVAVVTGGTASIDPEAGKIPIAGAEASIKQSWIENLQFELDALRVAKNKALYGDGPYPVLDFQFQGAKYLDPRIIFTRASVDWDGNSKKYNLNEPVLTDKGLKVGGVRANRIKWSGDFTNWTTIARNSYVEANKWSIQLDSGMTRSSARVEEGLQSGVYWVRIDFTLLDGANNTDGVFIGESVGTPANAARCYVHYSPINKTCVSLGAIPATNITVEEFGGGRIVVKFLFTLPSENSVQGINITPASTTELEPGRVYDILMLNNLTVTSVTEGVDGPIFTEGSQATVGSTLNVTNFEDFDPNNFSILIDFDLAGAPVLPHEYIFSIGTSSVADDFVGVRRRDSTGHPLQLIAKDQSSLFLKNTGNYEHVKLAISSSMGMLTISISGDTSLKTYEIAKGYFDKGHMRNLTLMSGFLSRSYVVSAARVRSVLVFDSALSGQQLQGLTS